MSTYLEGTKIPLRDTGRVQADVGFANTYRLELIKHVMTVSTALLGLTVTFFPSLHHPQYEGLLFLGWLGLGAAVLGGTVNLYCWELFYISYRDYEYKFLCKAERIHSQLSQGQQAELEQGYEDRKAAARRHRKKIKDVRRLFTLLQFGGAFIGVVSMSFFAGLNLTF